MDEVFYEILDPYEYGVGLNASRYSDFLQDEKHLESDCYIQCHSRYGGSVEEGIVSFDVTELAEEVGCDARLPHQVMTVGFNEDEDRPFDYTATVSADIYEDEEFDKDTLLKLFSGRNKVYIPFTSSVKVALLATVGPIPDPDDPDRPDMSCSRGVRLSHTLNIGKCEGGIEEPRMKQIFNLTLAMACYVLDKLETISRRSGTNKEV